MKKKVVILAVLLALLATTGYLLYHPGSRTSSDTLKTSSPEGYGMALFDPETGVNVGLVDLNGNREFNRNLRFLNHSGQKSSFLLIVYLNYEQIGFQLEGLEQTFEAYGFNLENGEEIVLPVRFDASKLPYKNNEVAFSVLAGPDKHAADMDAVTDFYSASTRYPLFDSAADYGDNGRQPEIPGEIQPVSDNFTGILLTPDMENKDLLHMPPSRINAKPGGKIRLLLMGGGVAGMEDYTVWVTVGWEQVLLDGGNPFLYLKIPKFYYGRKEIVFTAPGRIGKYEVCAFLCPNPWIEPQNANVEYRGIKTSYRFTLNVN